MRKSSETKKKTSGTSGLRTDVIGIAIMDIDYRVQAVPTNTHMLCSLYISASDALRGLANRAFIITE